MRSCEAAECNSSYPDKVPVLRHHLRPLCRSLMSSLPTLSQRLEHVCLRICMESPHLRQCQVPTHAKSQCATQPRKKAATEMAATYDMVLALLHMQRGNISAQDLLMQPSTLAVPTPHAQLLQRQHPLFSGARKQGSTGSLHMV